MGDGNELAVVDSTRRWISAVVIGLNLCPFARRVFDAGRVRYVVTAAANGETLIADLGGELRTLALAPREVVETTLLIHPRAFLAFSDYNDFLSDADRLVRDLGFRGMIQIASFHPEYQFAGTAQNAVENYTNRSPYPMLHLLREESISEVATDPAMLDAIPQRNIQTLRGLGLAEIQHRLRSPTNPRE